MSALWIVPIWLHHGYTDPKRKKANPGGLA